jgi:hypothetical protein
MGVEEDQEARGAHHCQPLDLQRMDHYQHVSAATIFESIATFGSVAAIGS